MWGSIAHAVMLGRQGIIPAPHAGKIANTLVGLQDKFISGEWTLGSKQEGMHLRV